METQVTRGSVERFFIDMKGLEEFTGMGKSWLWPRVVAGEIPSVKLGTRRLFPVGGIRQWAEQQCAEQSA